MDVDGERLDGLRIEAFAPGGHDPAAAIDDLEDDDREIILMRHQELLSNQEVAQAQGVTEAAASMRYLRAVRRLKDVLVGEAAS